jgi:hypothetical protein
MAFKKHLETNVDVKNDEYTAAWKYIRVNKPTRTSPGAGKSP